MAGQQVYSKSVILRSDNVELPDVARDKESMFFVADSGIANTDSSHTFARQLRMWLLSSALSERQRREKSA